MNYRKEPYPERLEYLLVEAKKIAGTLLNKLRHPDSKTLEELFAKRGDKIYRNFAIFNELGFEPNVYHGKCKNPKGNNEFKGVYLYGQEIDGMVVPIYVGISRTAYKRLRQHGFGGNHNESSLAYLIAKHHNKKISRANIHIDFKDDFKLKKSEVQSLRVAMYPIENDYDLYFLEVAIAGLLKTKWNSFRTH
jgi:hypothetical protein